MSEQDQHWNQKAHSQASGPVLVILCSEFDSECPGDWKKKWFMELLHPIKIKNQTSSL